MSKLMRWPSRSIAVDLITISHGCLLALPALGLLDIIPRRVAACLIPVALLCTGIAWWLWMRTLPKRGQ